MGIYSRILGKKSYIYHHQFVHPFLTGIRRNSHLPQHSPTTVDAVLAAHILLLTRPPFPDPLIHTLLKETYPSLVKHADSVLSHAFQQSIALIPTSPPENLFLQWLMPYPPHTASKAVQDEPEDGERLQWAGRSWIALSVFAVVLTVLTSGVQSQLLEGNKDKEEITQEGTLPAV